MDKLYNTQQELVQRVSVEHTRRLLGGWLGIVFYDVTTLYFESAKEDELRSPGFSNDGKNIKLLRNAGYCCIIGARIKNETQRAKDRVLSQMLGDGQFAELAR